MVLNLLFAVSFGNRTPNSHICPSSTALPLPPHPFFHSSLSFSSPSHNVLTSLSFLTAHARARSSEFGVAMRCDRALLTVQPLANGILPLSLLHLQTKRRSEPLLFYQSSVPAIVTLLNSFQCTIAGILATQHAFAPSQRAVRSRSRKDGANAENAKLCSTRNPFRMRARSAATCALKLAVFEKLL